MVGAPRLPDPGGMRRFPKGAAILGMCTAAALLSAGVARGYDIYAEVDGIPGDSFARMDAIDVHALEFVSQRSPRSPVEAGEVVFEHSFDRAGPLLWEAMWTGATIPSLTLSVALLTDRPVDVQDVVLTNVRLASIEQRHDSGENIARMRVSASFEDIEVTHRTLDPMGGTSSSTTGYNTSTGAPR